MTNDEPLTDMLGDAGASVYGSHSLEGTPEKKPFAVHHLGNDTSERLADGATPHRQFLTIYVHDEPEDYTNIDRILVRLKELFDNAPSSPADGVITCHYLESSQDLEDDQMGTAVRYIRLQIIGA
jgi:hypothetical protein